MPTPEITQLMDHMAWADAVVWRALDALPAAAADERIRVLIHHVHSVQWVYLQLLRGEEVEIPELDDDTELEAVRGWGREAHLQLAAFVEDLDEAGLERAMDIPWARHFVDDPADARSTTVRQALLQMTSHSTYHRGQMNTRIRELGGEPPLTDFVAWVWAGEPSAEW